MPSEPFRQLPYADVPELPRVSHHWAETEHNRAHAMEHFLAAIEPFLAS